MQSNLYGYTEVSVQLQQVFSSHMQVQKQGKTGWDAVSVCVTFIFPFSLSLEENPNTTKDLDSFIIIRHLNLRQARNPIIFEPIRENSGILKVLISNAHIVPYCS